MYSPCMKTKFVIKLYLVVQKYSEHYNQILEEGFEELLDRRRAPKSVLLKLY